MALGDGKKLKSKIGEYDWKWLEETREKQLKKDDGKRNEFLLAVMKKHLSKS